MNVRFSLLNMAQRKSILLMEAALKKFIKSEPNSELKASIERKLFDLTYSITCCYY
jgi:hypothetical protein